MAAERIPVRLTCGVLGFSPQAYYAWSASPVTDWEWADAHTINVLLDAHDQDPEFGYRFLVDELNAAGYATCEPRAWLAAEAVVDHDEEWPPRQWEDARAGSA